MPCTTLLVGKHASYDGSTMIARNDDAPSNHFTAKKLAIFAAQNGARTYRSVLSHVEIPLPETSLRCTAMPNALAGEGIWAAAGVNEANVAMTATETITSNPRVLAADPLVVYTPAAETAPEQPGGIGEEDIVCLVLPYIKSAREGVLRLGKLLEQYGTYEMNGIAFQDLDEIWWFETIGGHHWIARRVPDDAYVVMPNQFGIDRFDLKDAFSAQSECLCSEDLREFLSENHLDLALPASAGARDAASAALLDARAAFGSHEDADHVYNTPRAWYMLRYFNPHTKKWDGPDADYTPVSDDLPWCMVPEKKITLEDVKYVLSSHYQGTEYDPYAASADEKKRGMYRPIGISRNDFLGLFQLRPYAPSESCAIEWAAFASNTFNVMAPIYGNVDAVPAYFANTGETVSTDNFYWTSRLIAAMADASYKKSIFHIERYQLAVQSKTGALLHKYDKLLAAETDPEKRKALREQGNQEIADLVQHESNAVLGKVLFELSLQMKNTYARSDA